MARQQAERSDYPELLRTLGHFIQQEHLSEVSLLEFDRGWVISGLTYKTTAQGFIRVPVDYVLSYDQLRAMNQGLVKQRRLAQPAREGWQR